MLVNPHRLGVWLLPALVLACPALGEGQAAPDHDGVNLRILAVGSFLGQLDGFCENPGDPSDLLLQPEPCTTSGHGWPAVLGGVLGARDWVDRERARPGPAPLLFIAGNNQVPDAALLTLPAARRASVASQYASRMAQASARAAFWVELSRLDPQAVAMGADDFVRSLRLWSQEAAAAWTAGDRGRYFVEWVRAGGRDPVSGTPLRLPLLASNVALRVPKDDLNRIDQGGYELLIEDDESIEWLEQLAVEHPCAHFPTFQLEELALGRAAPGQGVAVPTSAPSRSAGPPCKSTLQLTGGALRPGRSFRLTAADAATSTTRIFTFRTHEALTPHVNAALTAIEDYPAIAVATAGGHVAVVVSLVDPGVRRALGSTAWKWTGPTCPADACDIAFLDPVKTLRAILTRVAAVAPIGQPPFVILLSSLRDSDTLKVLDAFPEIRAVILPPDSQLLGRAARQRDARPSDVLTEKFTAAVPRGAAKQPFSGDLGFAAVMGPDGAHASLLVVRPEWLGETGGLMEARLERDPQGQWQLTRPAVGMQAIPGSRLQHRSNPAGVAYHTIWRGRRIDLGLFPAYLACSDTPPPACTDFANVWSQAVLLRIVAGDAVKAALRADIAVIPADAIDEDVSGWLAEAVSHESTDWISRFVLERAIYRSYRFVRADVSGESLLATLARLAQDPLRTGSAYCFTALGQAQCPGAVDPDHPERLRIEGRVLRPEHYYTVALPDALAEALALQHSDDERNSIDLLGALDRHLASGSWFPGPGAGGLPQRLEKRREWRNRPYWNVSPLQVGFNELKLSDRLKSDGAPATIPTSFSGAEQSRTWSLKIDSDFAPLDVKRQSLRLLGRLDYSRRRDPSAVTMAADEFLIGARLDVWKVRLLRDLRPFIGYFLDGQTEEAVTTLVASRQVPEARPGFALSERAPFTTRYTVLPSRYRYAAVGVDILNIKEQPFGDHFSLSLPRFSLIRAEGTALNVPTGVRVGGSPQDLNILLENGPAALLNGYFQANPDLADDPGLVLETADPNQGRREAELQIEGQFTRDAGKAYKVAVGLRSRRYVIENAPALNLKSTQKITVKVTVPLFWRVELVPGYEYERATIQSGGTAFSVHRLDARFAFPLFARATRRGFVE